MRTLLILGGTGEAAVLAEAAVDRFADRLRVVSSLAGRTRAPRPLAGTVRVGGFGGAEGLAGFLRAEDVAMVVDATHPYAARISANARAACGATGTPRAMLLRPPWRAGPGDRWIEAADTADAARRLPGLGRRPFLALGSGDIAAFAGLPDLAPLLRVAEQPEAPPLPGADIVVGRGPFDAAAEHRLLAERGVDVLVSRNSGGAATYGKIAAARRLGIPVVMIARPPAEPGARFDDMEELLTWIAGNCGE